MTQPPPPQEPRRGRRPGRPRTAMLSADKIAHAALAVIDRAGWDRCTMQALGQELGVRAPSLYHHITGQEQLVHLVRAIIAGRIHDPRIAELPWDEALIAFGSNYYRVFAAHPNTIQKLSVTPIEDPVTLEMYECFLGAMTAAGWDDATSMDMLLGVEHLALGLAFERNATGLMFRSDTAARLGAPTLARITDQRTNQTQIVDDSFAALLRRFVAMFRAEAPPPGQAPRAVAD